MDEYLHGWERGYAAAMGLWDDALAARAVRELQSVGGYKKTEIEGLRRGFLALFLARGHPTARFLNHMSAGKGTLPPAAAATALQALTAVLVIAHMLGALRVRRRTALVPRSSYRGGLRQAACIGDPQVVVCVVS